MSGLISIITPFKNTSRYLKDCLESVLRQSYAQWEMILVDDHSTDDSRAIVESFAAQDMRFRILENRGEGIIPALQTGYRVARGGFITRMDSDDIMAKEKLATMRQALEAAGKGHIALGQVRYFSDRGISDGYARYERWLNALTARGTNFSEIYKECVIPSPCFMMHRSDFEAIGGFEHNRYPEDYDLAFRMLQGGMKCLSSSELLHQWRDYDTRTSRTHVHYAQNYFLDVKTYYFLKLHHDSSRPLTIWGAGTKGKTVASLLLKAGVDFHWICDNPKKIGKKIYGKLMEPFDEISALNKPQCIVTVANASAQNEINAFFETNEMQPMLDYFFFC